MIVVSLVGFAFWHTRNASAEGETVVLPSVAPSQPTAQPVVTPGPAVSVLSLPSLDRDLKLDTIIPERPRYAVLNYTVRRGDALVRIAKEFGIQPQTLLWANFPVLKDDPHGLKPGQELQIPPIDGLLYQWKEGDAIETVAATYRAKAEDIVNWPGNNLDLSDPRPQPGQWVMIWRMA